MFILNISNIVFDWFSNGALIDFSTKTIRCLKPIHQLLIPSTGITTPTTDSYGFRVIPGW